MSTDKNAELIARARAHARLPYGGSELAALLADLATALEDARDAFARRFDFDWLPLVERERLVGARLKEDPTGVIAIMAAHFLDILDDPSIAVAPPERRMPGYVAPPATGPAPNYVEFTMHSPGRGWVAVDVRRYRGKSPGQLQREAEAETERVAAELAAVTASRDAILWALCAYRYYTDASTAELREAGITRGGALAIARDAEDAAGNPLDGRDPDLLTDFTRDPRPAR